MRTFTFIAAFLLLVGCKRSTEPAGQTPEPVPQNPTTTVKKEEPKKERTFPLDQDKFKAAVSGSTRDQVLAKCGPPDEVGEWGAAAGWDGPVSIYMGPFTGAEGKQAAKARLYFRQQNKMSVVVNVEFVDK